MENKFAEAATRDHEIDLKFFVTVLRKCWYFVILAAVLFGLVAGLYSSLFIEKKYSSTVNMYVDPNATSSAGTLNSSTADALAATYPPVIRHSDDFARAVALEMALLKDKDGSPAFPSWTYETVEDRNGTHLEAKEWRRVRSMMSTGIKDNDKIFYITIRSADPKEAYEMACIAAEVAPDELNEIVGVGHVTVLEDPVMASSPDSPNVLRNAVLAAIVGAVLVYAIFFLVRLFDTTIYTEADLARFDLPILGVVPSFPSPESERSTKNESDKGV